MATVIGYRPVDFVSAKGDHIEGVKLYVSYPEKGVEGEVVEEGWLDKECSDALKLKVGDTGLLLLRNRKGRISGAYRA